MRAHIEWLTREIGVLRVGSRFFEYGDPYEASCTVYRGQYPGSKTMILGFTSTVPFTREMRRAIRKVLVEAAITNVIWERVKPGELGTYIKAREHE